MTRSSPVLSAWTLQIYLRYEAVIADLVAPRIGDLSADDPRPRLIGAMAMASVRIALDDWLEHGGSLPTGCGRPCRHCTSRRRARAAADYSGVMPVRTALRPGVVSPTLPVPRSIVRPEYVGKPTAQEGSEPWVQTPEVIEKMRVAGRIAAARAGRGG